MTPARPGGRPVRVSVIVQSYNQESYIGRALEGILEQHGAEPWEVLVGDDCSTDGTRAVITEYARRRPDVIRPVFPEVNLGLGGKALFDDLVGRCRGRYIAVLDGDDYWTSADKVRIQTEYLDEHPECAMVFHNAVRRTEDGHRPDLLHNSPEQPPRVDLDQLLDVNPVAACTPVFRREALDPLPAWYFTLPWGDWPLYLVALRCGQIHYLPDVMGVYRIHGDGMYSGLSPLEQQEVTVQFFEGLAGVLPLEADERRRRRLALAMTDVARQHVRLGQPQTAWRWLGDSFRTWPVDPRTLGRGQLERRRLVACVAAALPPRWVLRLVDRTRGAPVAGREPEPVPPGGGGAR